MQKKNYIKDEILEALWVLEEKNLSPTAENIFGRNKRITAGDIENAVNEGLISFVDETYALTEKGRAEASMLLRRHRLAERLMNDVLEMKAEELEKQACEFEHILSSETADSICTLLNHPRECPHGGPIPEGKCCRDFRSNPSKVVLSLSELAPGEYGRILYLRSAGDHSQLHRLGDLGIAPGETVKVHQHYPVAVLRVGETDIAMDRSILKRIFVRRKNMRL